MAGHSKWAQIKRKKAVTDAKRSSLFTRLSRAIIVAAQEGGGDPDHNFALRFAIEQAKAANVPGDNIERAIKRGIGASGGDVKFQTVVYEGRTASNISILIQCQSDNLNRSLTDVRTIVEGHFGGKLSGAGSVSWQFRECGVVVLQAEPREELILAVMSLPGVLEVEAEDDGIYVTTEKELLSETTKKLSEFGQIVLSEILHQPQTKVKVTEAQQAELQELISELEDCNDVINVWHNAESQ